MSGDGGFTVARQTVADPDVLTEITQVFGIARREAMPWLPILHTPAEDMAFLTDYLPDSQIWLARDHAQQLLGFIVFDDVWIDQLYLVPAAHRRGIGAALVKQAIADGLPKQLWCFQQNTAARAFYEALGFAVVELTDGATNEEKLPDIRYRYPGFH